MTAQILHLVPPAPPAEPEAQVLTPEQSNVLALVFADALSYRTPPFCEDCVDAADGLCADHAADLDRTDDYVRLATELGVDLEATEAGIGGEA